VLTGGDDTHEQGRAKKAYIKKIIAQEEGVADEMTIFFIYKKPCGDISARSGKGAYRCRFCGNDYINTRSDGIRKTFKVSRIVKVFSTREELEEAPLTEYEQEDNKELLLSLPRTKKREYEEDVYITGFSKEDRSELLMSARGMGLIVRRSIVVGLDMFCYGENTQVRDIKKAVKYGVEIVDYDEFEAIARGGR
jgi:NAD-dependent DNA ligase